MKGIENELEKKARVRENILQTKSFTAYPTMISSFARSNVPSPLRTPCQPSLWFRIGSKDSSKVARDAERFDRISDGSTSGDGASGSSTGGWREDEAIGLGLGFEMLIFQWFGARSTLYL